MPCGSKTRAQYPGEGGAGGGCGMLRKTMQQLKNPGNTNSHAVRDGFPAQYTYWEIPILPVTWTSRENPHPCHSDGVICTIRLYRHTPRLHVRYKWQTDLLLFGPFLVYLLFITLFQCPDIRCLSGVCIQQLGTWGQCNNSPEYQLAVIYLNKYLYYCDLRLPPSLVMLIYVTLIVLSISVFVLYNLSAGIFINDTP